MLSNRATKSFTVLAIVRVVQDRHKVEPSYDAACFNQGKQITHLEGLLHDG